MGPPAAIDALDGAAPALALAVLLVLAGCGLPGGIGDGGDGDDGDLTATVDWVAGDSEILGNHHSPGVGRAEVLVPYGDGQLHAVSFD